MLKMLRVKDVLRKAKADGLKIIIVDILMRIYGNLINVRTRMGNF